jgi:hypothetical protein
VVDRTIDPVFHLDWSVPYEDVTLGPDELEDSRRFEFFAFCRQPGPGQALPNWILESDAERALAAGIIEAMPVASEVLETSLAWTGPGDCVQPLASEGRIPITCEVASRGLDWDTTDAPAGNYIIEGYTFEPPLNRWAARRGVVQITDGPDVRPVVSLTSPSGEGTRAYEASGFRVLGCMGGPPGTMVTLSWAAATALDDPEPWQRFAELDATQCEIDQLFEPPVAAVSQAVWIRAVAVGPDGDAWEAWAPHAVVVLPGEGQVDASEPVAPDVCGLYVNDMPQAHDAACEEAGESSGSGASGDEETASSDDDRGGCACRAGRQPAAGPARPAQPGGSAMDWIAWLAMFVVAPLRRPPAPPPRVARGPTVARA